MGKGARLLVAAASVAWAFNCGGGVTPPAKTGSEHGACYGNGTCDSGLSCLSGLCVNPDSGSGGRGVTTGSAGATGTAGGTTTGTGGGNPISGPCTITSTHADSSCENNCLDSVDPGICLNGCHDITTHTPGMLCKGQCIDTSSDNANCGGCDKACAGTCTNGICLRQCSSATTPASIASACTSLCAKMGPQCGYNVAYACSLFSAFVPSTSQESCAGLGVPWTSQAACIQLCENQVHYTGPCADAVGAAMSCWGVTCSGGNASFDKTACDTLDKAAQSCVDTCLPNGGAAGGGGSGTGGATSTGTGGSGGSAGSGAPGSGSAGSTGSGTAGTGPGTAGTSGSAGSTGSGTAGSVGTGTAGHTATMLTLLPVAVTSHWFPSAWSGDSVTVAALDDAQQPIVVEDQTNASSGPCAHRALGAVGRCYKVSYTPVSSESPTFASVELVPNFPGTTAPNFIDLSMAPHLPSGAAFARARVAGDVGGEIVTLNLVGTEVNDAVTSPFSSAQTWQEISVPLSPGFDQELSPFSWRSSSPTPITFYYDDVRIE